MLARSSCTHASVGVMNALVAAIPAGLGHTVLMGGPFVPSPALGPVPELDFVAQLVGLGAAVGAALALRMRRRHPEADVWAITTAWASLGAIVGVLICSWRRSSDLGSPELAACGLGSMMRAGLVASKLREVAIDVALEVLPGAAVASFLGLGSERAVCVSDVEVLPVHVHPPCEPDPASAL